MSNESYPSRKPGLVRRFFRAIWNALNFTRRLALNLIVLAIIIAIVSGLLSRTPVIEPDTALVLNLEGTIVEQFTADATMRAIGRATGNQKQEIQLRDVLRTIDAAAKDPAISRIVLIPDGISGAGVSTLREIGQALDRFRQSGKPVTAIANDLGQGQYFLAIHADQILLDPDGSVLLSGFASYRSYYKELLDRLGVDIHLFKVGTFKSAAEPYVLNEASEPAKEADRAWMGALWNEYLGEVAALRKLDASALQADIAAYDERIVAVQGDLAKLALDQKLVDRLATRAEARQWLRDQGVPAEGDSFRQIAWTDYLQRQPPANPLATQRVAVVVAEGEILAGEQPPGSIGGDSTAQLLRSAREDDGVSAIVLRVNSPGGDAIASERIRREVVQAKEAGKPVVVSMGDYAASGGYWISMDADEIWAQPTTVTGSIGIYGLFATIPQALAKIGVSTDGIGTTPLAGAMDIRRPLSPQVGTILTTLIERGYREFVGRVAKARGKPAEQIENVARGRVWTGSQALEHGLVDKLGGLDAAIAAAAARADLGSDYAVSYVEPPLSMWERVALQLSQGRAAQALMKPFVSTFTLPLPTALLDSVDWRAAKQLLDQLGSRRYGVYAHCFCDLR